MSNLLWTFRLIARTLLAKIIISNVDVVCLRDEVAACNCTVACWNIIVRYRRCDIGLTIINSVFARTNHNGSNYNYVWWVVFTARCYACAVYAMALCLSVRPSVTSRCSTKTAKRRITQITPNDIAVTLVFCCQRSRRNSTGITLCEGAKCTWGSGGHTGGASGAVHQGPRPLRAHQQRPDSNFFEKLTLSYSDFVHCWRPAHQLCNEQFRNAANRTAVSLSSDWLAN